MSTTRIRALALVGLFLVVALASSLLVPVHPSPHFLPGQNSLRTFASGATLVNGGMVSNAGTAVTSIVVGTLDISNNASWVLYLFVSIKETAGTTVSVASVNDTGHDQFVPAAVSTNTGNSRVEVWYNDTPSSANPEFLTTNFTASASVVVTLYRIQGAYQAFAGASLDSIGTVAAGTSSIAQGFITTNYVGDLVLLGETANTSSATPSVTPNNGSGIIQTKAGGSNPNKIVQGVGRQYPAATGVFNESVNIGGTYPWAAVAVALRPALPSKVTGLTIGSVTTTTVPLTWTNPRGPLVNDTVLYHLNACPAFNQLAAWTQISVGVVTSYTVTGLSSGTQYCFSIMAWNSSGPSNVNIPPVKATTTATPGPPYNLIIASTTATTAVLTWTNPTTMGTIVNDTVFWGPICALPYAHSASTAGLAVTYTMTGLSPSTFYCATVEAWNATTNSGLATGVAFATNGTKPSAPTGLTVVTRTSSTISLSWTNPSQPLLNLTVYAGLVCGTYTVRLAEGYLATTAKVTGLVSLTTYCLAVSAWNSSGQSPLSSTVSVATLVAPVAPQMLSSAPPTGQVGERVVYTLQASLPVNWSLRASPAGFSLLTSPLWVYATLSGNLTAPGSATFSVYVVGALGGATWQNWTTAVAVAPFVSGTPAMVVATGTYYDYKPQCSNCAGPTWRFSGAPYLTLNTATGELSGTVQAGTFQNTLTLNTSSANWVQSWFVSTQSLPLTITASGNVGNHVINATVPDVDVLGIGRGGVFLGQFILTTPAELVGTATYLYTFVTATQSTAYIAAANAGNTTLTIYAYAAPFATPTVLVNSQTYARTTNSGGYTFVSIAAPVVTVNPGGNGGGGGVTATATNLSATGVTTTAVTLAWNSTGGPAYFLIHFGPSCSNMGSSQVAYTSPATVSGLQPGTGYCFQVTTVGGWGAAGTSNAVSATTPLLPGLPGIHLNGLQLRWQSTLAAVSGIAALIVGVFLFRSSQIVGIVVGAGGIALVVLSFFV